MNLHKRISSVKLRIIILLLICVVACFTIGCDAFVWIDISVYEWINAPYTANSTIMTKCLQSGDYLRFEEYILENLVTEPLPEVNIEFDGEYYHFTDTTDENGKLEESFATPPWDPDLIFTLRAYKKEYQKVTTNFTAYAIGSNDVLILLIRE